MQTLISDKKKKKKLCLSLRDYAHSAWSTMEVMHQLMLDDDQPENEKARLDPDHWYVLCSRVGAALLLSFLHVTCVS